MPIFPLNNTPSLINLGGSNKKCFLRKVRNRFWRAPPCREAEIQPVQSLWFILAALSKIVKIDIRCWILDVIFFKLGSNLHKISHIPTSNVQNLICNFPHSFQKFLLAKYPAFDLTTPDFSSKINIEHLFVGLHYCSAGESAWVVMPFLHSRGCIIV